MGKRRRSRPSLDAQPALIDRESRIASDSRLLGSAFQMHSRIGRRSKGSVWLCLAV